MHTTAQWKATLPGVARRPGQDCSPSRRVVVDRFRGNRQALLGAEVTVATGPLTGLTGQVVGFANEDSVYLRPHGLQPGVVIAISTRSLK